MDAGVIQLVLFEIESTVDSELRCYKGALVMEDYKVFALREVPMPEPGPDEVLVRVRACAVYEKAGAT